MQRDDRPSDGQLDPRLFNPPGTGPSQAAPAASYPSSHGSSEVDQHHQLPPLSNNAPLQQPYYRLPPASTPFQQPQPSHPSQVAHESPHESTSDRRDSQRQQSSHSREESPSNAGLNIDPNDPKRSRACEACRGLKVRCDRDESDPGKPCKRCAKARRNCVITAPSRKRQKKTDSRVAELEKKIDALTADLRKHRTDQTNGSSNYGRDGDPLSPPQSTHSASTNRAPTPPTAQSWRRDLADRAGPPSTRRRKPSPQRRRVERAPDVETYLLNHRPTSSQTEDSDSVISQASSDLPFDTIVDQEVSTRIFNRYVAEMAQHLPAVMFESDTTAAEIRANRPILFLAILDTASVGMLDLEIQQRLNEMLLDVYANSILRQGEKSLDLVQALMVSTIWYRPPKRYEQMNVYMLTHIAALMALDFGMGRKLNASRNMRVAANVGQSEAPKTFLRSDSVEARRTWLGCYFVCMNVSLSLRRPNFIRWNAYLDECIKVLESAPETLPSDKLLCQHVKLMHINEEVGVRFSMDDPAATIAISDPRVQFAIGAFEKRLDEWVKGVPRTQWDLSLEFSQHFSRLYMHEIALHNNHNIDDFRAPFTEESLKAPSLQAKSLTPYHNGLLQQCLTAVHDMFRTFAAFDMVTVKALPIFYFVRIAYAVVVLIKLHNAVSDPNSDLLFREEDLHVEYHLEKLLEVFQRMAAQDAFRPARMFMVIVGKLLDGFKNSNSNGHRGRGAPPPPPNREPMALEMGVLGDRKISKLDGSSLKTTKPKQSRQSSASEASSQSRTGSLSTQSQTQYARHPQQESRQMQPQNGQMLQQPHQQPPHPSMQQQIAQMSYANTQNPLHFLSEVATNNAPASLLGFSTQQQQAQPQQQQEQPQQEQPQQGWYHAPMQHQQSGPMLMNYGQGMDAASFEQAVDMTMSIGEGDLSSLFMEGNDYGFGPGMIPEGQMGAFGHLSGVGNGGGWAGFGDGPR